MAKQKKMTCKQFKEAFELSHHFDAFGWDGILNMLILAERYAAETGEKLGYLATVKISREAERIWTEYLDARGYYDLEDKA